MEKEFVPYQEALELKELGFEDYCVGMYAHASKNTIENQFVIHTCKASSKLVWMKMPAPLYQQAFRWFREKYNLYSEIDLDSYKEPYLLKVSINHLDETNTFVDEAYYPSGVSGIDTFNNTEYSNAELGSLKKLIKIVKNGV